MLDRCRARFGIFGPGKHQGHYKRERDWALSSELTFMRKFWIESKWGNYQRGSF